MATYYSAPFFSVGQVLEDHFNQLFHSAISVLDESGLEKARTAMQSCLNLGQGFESQSILSHLYQGLFPEMNWFENPALFQILQGQLIRTKAPIRWWSVGAGLGYEAYSLSCTVSDLDARLALHCLQPLEILGTDLSFKTLQTAQKAQYTEAQLSGLSHAQRQGFFKPISNGIYQLQTKEQSRVHWLEQDILGNLQHLGEFQAILCSHIPAYFGETLQKVLAYRLIDRLKPGGFLYLNQQLTLQAMPSIQITPIGKGFLYQKPEGKNP